MASGWNLWVWLVSVVVRKYIIDILIIIITFFYSTCISSFLAAASLFSLFIFLMGFGSCNNNKKNAQWRFFTSRGPHVNCAIMAMLYTHSIEKSAVEHNGGV